MSMTHVRFTIVCYVTELPAHQTTSAIYLDRTENASSRVGVHLASHRRQVIQDVNGQLPVPLIISVLKDTINISNITDTSIPSEQTCKLHVNLYGLP